MNMKPYKQYIQMAEITETSSYYSPYS